MILALMAQESGGQIAQIAATFGVDWPHLLAQVLSFGIVCALLYWFAYQPVLQMLDARRAQIAQGLANTDKINAALANIEAQRQGVLAEARAQSEQIVTEARHVAARLREQDRQHAIAAAEQIVLKAREAAAQEHARMLGDLRREVGRLVVQTTGVVLGKVLTADDHRRLSEAAANHLTAS